MFFCRKVGEETALNALLLGAHQLGVILPTHILHEVGGTRNQHGTIRADEVVAALAVSIAYPARKGEYVAVVGLGNLAGDESSSVDHAFDEDTGIRHSCHDAVAAHEVDFIGVRLGQKFREQSALFYHP